MNGARTKKLTRTIRLTIPNDIYARLAYLAAAHGVSVPELGRTALLQVLVNGGRIPLEDATAILNLELGGTLPSPEGAPFVSPHGEEP